MPHPLASADLPVPVALGVVAAYRFATPGLAWRILPHGTMAPAAIARPRGGDGG